MGFKAIAENATERGQKVDVVAADRRASNPGTLRATECRGKDSVLLMGPNMQPRSPSLSLSRNKIFRGLHRFRQTGEREKEQANYRDLRSNTVTVMYI